MLIVLFFSVFSIKDMDVKDPMPNAKAPVIVTKVEKHKDIVLLDVSCVHAITVCQTLYATCTVT